MLIQSYVYKMNQQLREKYVLRTQPYRGILYLLWKHGKLEFKHFNYILSENHGYTLIDNRGKTTKIGRDLLTFFSNGKKDYHELHKEVMKKVECEVERKISDIYDGFYMPKLSGKAPRNQLNMDLNRFLKMKSPLIIKDEKSKTYSITKRGLNLIQREFLHWMIDIVPDETIPEILEYSKIGQRTVL